MATNKSTTTGGPAGRQLALESLEERCLLSSTQTIDLSALQATGNIASDNILVQFKSSGTPTALAGTTIGQALPLVNNLYQVNLNPGVTVAQALAEYQSSPLVQMAEADAELTVSSTTTPNDPGFGNQWDMQTGTHGINATTAWNTTNGSSNPVTVAVMDSGVDYNNTDLADNIWINQAEIPTLSFAPGTGLTGSRYSLLESVNNGKPITFAELNNAADQGLGKITDVNGDGIIDAGDILAPMQTVTIDGKVYDTGKGGWAYNGNTQDGDTAHPNDFIGWNFVNNTNNPFDDNGHGTHVSGTIGAVGNNGTGIAGVDWNVQIMPVKFLDSNGQGSVSDFIEGLNYSIQHGAKITNNSWAGAPYSQALQDAVSTAQSAGQIFVAAAGNSGVNTDVNPNYPSNLGLNNVVSVAATDQNGNLASFSNYGATTVDLAAPGVGIYSTLPGNTYGYMSGTSMATPHVTGVMALVWSEHPTWNYTQVINQVLDTVTKESSLSGKVATGGILNAAAAVGATSTAVPVQVLSVQPILSSNGTLTGVTIAFNSPMNVSTINSGSVTLTGPNGAIYSPTGAVAVAGTNNQTIQVSFGSQTTAGTYTVTVGSGARDSTGGATTSFRGSFTIGGVTQPTPPAPQVVNVQPTLTSSGALTGVVITFSQSMDASTIGANSVSLTGPDGKVYFPTQFGAVNGTNNTQFQLAFGNLSDAGTYTLSVTNQAHSSAGTALSPYRAGITVHGAAAPPTPQVVTVQPVQSNSGALMGVIITFDRSMSPATINASTVTITAPNGTVYRPTWIGSLAGTSNKQFQLSFGTLPGSGTFTVSITNGVTDSTGTRLVAYKTSLSINATTPTPPSPTVVSAQPTVTSNGVLTGVTITFSQAMNAATIGSSVTLTASNGTVYKPTGVTAVTNSGNKSFVLSFANLPAGTYTLSVSTSAKSSAGASTVAYKTSVVAKATQSSTTVVSATPVLTNGKLTGVTITFSGAISPATVNASTVTITASNGKVYTPTWIGALAGTGNTKFQLNFGTLPITGSYTLTVTANVRNAAGSSIAPFKGTYTQPTVAAADVPTDDSSDVIS
jgi:subtilisin family serine protease